ncbi:hypothetical protein [Ralstonia insidiosa]|uniref:Uncharacterized protein n=1 Tax=Ralstonia insidiosa TaxID=190721 RepID=A0A848PB10_9RALS|nr:hypothetical protein [Ralstonia insidiosa]NMV41844.1 hypothetical protein [Ralstonia insidiosa]
MINSDLSSDRSLTDAQIKAAAHGVNSVISLVQNLCRFAYKADDEEDFAAFHGLLWDLLPQIGLRLDQVKADLGHGRVGVFADGMLTSMYQGERND